MIDLSNTVTHLHHRIGLTTEACLDIQWWLDFLPGWSGISLILNTRWIPLVALHLYSDASGAHWWGDGKWLQSCWSLPQTEMDITWKELFAIVLAVHTWGCFCMICRRDLGQGLYSCTSHNGFGLFVAFCASSYNIDVCVIHVPGVCNDIADYLVSRWTDSAPKANPLPDHIPSWPMQSFTAASCSAGIMALPNPPDKPTNQGLQSLIHSAISTPSSQFQHHR